MRLFRKELEILDRRLSEAEKFCDELISENKSLQRQLIEERKELFEDKKQLELDKSIFEKERENAFEVAHMQNGHLEAELAFIKEHRMLPVECKFFTKMPRIPQSMKKLKKKNKRL